MADANYELPEEGVVTRLQYFHGQFLQAQDFIDEQLYHLDRLRRHLRLLYTPGILEGLEVRLNGSGLRVTAGTALDSAGRLIVLTEDELIDLDLGEYKGKSAYLIISYSEEGTNPSSNGGHGETRWHEKPKLELVSEDAKPEDTVPEGIKLALLNFNADGKLTIDDDSDVRVYAGLRLPNRQKEPPILRSRDAGTADIESRLRVISGEGDDKLIIEICDGKLRLHEGGELNEVDVRTVIEMINRFGGESEGK